MFSISHNLYSLCMKSSIQNYTILVLGVDGAGKTTLINTLKGELSDPEAGVATFGRSNSNVKNGTAMIKLIDIGGGKNMRSYWKDAFSECHAWIYVVDSAAAARFEETKSMLFETAGHESLESKPMLMLLNKRDLPEAVSEADMAKQLACDELQGSWHLQKCTALRTAEDEAVDSGITDGLAWLSKAVANDFGNLDSRVERDIILQKKLETEANEKRKAERKARKEQREREADEEAAKLECCVPPVGVPEAPTTPLKTLAPEAAPVTPGELPPLIAPMGTPSKGELPALRGVNNPLRLEPLQGSPGFSDPATVPEGPSPWKHPINGVIQDSPMGPPGRITDHPNVPPGSPIEASFQ